MHARPVPSNPYNPAPGSSSSSTAPPSSARYPSPFLPIRIPVFAPVLWLERPRGGPPPARRLALDGPTQAARRWRRRPPTEGVCVYGCVWEGGGRGRAMSDETVQSVEEGGGAEDTSGTTRTRGLERERVVSGRFRGPEAEDRLNETFSLQQGDACLSGIWGVCISEI